MKMRINLPKVSMVLNVKQTTCQDVELSHLWYQIKNGTWKPLIEKIRKKYQEEGKKGVDSLKKQLPGFMVSGLFSKRNTDGLIEHSGLLCLDIDEISNIAHLRKKFEDDLYVYVCFTSPTGSGLKVIIRILPDVTQHQATFERAKNYFNEKYNVEIDPSGKDVCRLCFVSYDPDIIIRKDVQILYPETSAPPLEHGDKGEEDDYAIQAKTDVKEYGDNDAGRAERLIDLYQHDVRFVPTWDQWIVFQDGRWQIDRDGAMKRLCVNLSKSELEDAIKITNNATRNYVIKAALALGDQRVIYRTLELAKIDQRVIADESDIDDNPWLVGANNGVINLKTGEIMSHCRENLITKYLGTEIDPTAKCPRWLKFINEVFPDKEVAKFIWKVVGYCLTGHVSEQCFIFLHGSGSNGKTTFIEILQSIFGSYGMRASDAILRYSANGKEPEGAIAEISGKRLILGSETEEGSRLNEKLIKDITGGDTLRGRRLYEESFSFKPTAKLMIYGNYKPEIRGGDDGIWRRVLLVSFIQQFTGDQKDPDLPAKLRAELPGILNWMVQGCLIWQQEKLNPPAVVMEAVKLYREDEDILGDFIASNVRMNPKASIFHAELYARYQEWAEEEGIRYVITSKKLAKKMRERKFVDGRKSGGGKGWMNISLSEDFPPVSIRTG